MLSLPLRRLSSELNCVCLAALALLVCALTLASSARPGEQQLRPASRSARCGRSPTTTAASPGSSSAPRTPRRTPTSFSLSSELRPRVPALDGRSGRPGRRRAAARPRRARTAARTPVARPRPGASCRTASTGRLQPAADAEPAPDLSRARHPELRSGPRCDERPATLRLWQERSAAAALARLRACRAGAPRSTPR